MSAAARKKKSHRSKPKEPTPRADSKLRMYRPPGSIPFPQVQSKTVADFYLTADADLNCVTLRFNDNTELVVHVEPSVRFTADYSDWKTGDQRVIKRWPRIRSV